MSKLVSICIPAYNSSEYIGRTIESVLSQTYDNIELVQALCKYAGCFFNA